MVPYRAILDVSTELIRNVSRLLADERRRRRGTRRHTRALSCYKQAVLVVRHFRDTTDAHALAKDNAISRATSYRYIDEGIDVLADHAPRLHDALRAASDNDNHTVLDGKLFPCDRCREPNTDGTTDLWYSGHKHRHGGNIQFLANDAGHPLWASDVEPGSTADITAARLHALPAVHKAAADGW
ncbi:transposase family protein [Allosalinactinospora lopnorensis]|uniref:transposase family protein n=1 Tax=Allosalinactinospora lopnorensis TaxID=1352348 RepID=UPI0022A9852B|nr:transposase family protein [Allosalinactinospora lopnorensis]